MLKPEQLRTFNGMITIAGRAWEVFGGLGAPKLVTREAAVLLILAAILLVFRTFRERCLMIWIVGWIAYLGSSHALTNASHGGLYSEAVGRAEFVLAIALFTVGTFVYTNSKDLQPPVVVASLVLIVFAFIQGLWWQASETLRFALELAYRVLTFGAAVQVLRFNRARKEIGPWILASGLILLHLPWRPVSSVLPSEMAFLPDIVLGLGMLFVVFDESHWHTQKLVALHNLATSIGRSAPDSNLAAGSLKGLKELMGVDAVWLRLVGDHRLVISEQIGLSMEFLRDRMSVAVGDAAEQLPRENRPKVLSRSQLREYMQPTALAEQLGQLVIVTVPGRKAPVGSLTLGSRRSKRYSPAELEFLTLCAQQLGLILENLHLVEDILRSHRQWSNTFESIQDLVLLHDSEYRIVKANPALLRLLGKSHAEVFGQRCDQVLPKVDLSWTNCPYCRGHEDGFYEGPDPLGGFSVASTSTYVDQGTKKKGTIHVVRDITERRAAEEKYRSIFEQVREGVFVATPEGKLLDCNDAFVHMLGYSAREELLGRNVDAEFYASPEQRKVFRREVEAHNFVRNFEVSLRRKDGSLVTALESSFATRDADGKINNYQGFLLDISEKKQAEDEIKRRNRELNALNAMAVIATQSFDLDEILNLTLRQVISLFSAESGSIYLAQSGTNFRCRATWGHSITDRKRYAELDFPEGFGDLVTGARAEVLTAEYLPHLPQAVSEFLHAADMGSSMWVVLWGKDSPLGLMGVSRAANHQYTNNDESLFVAVGRQLATTVEKVQLYEETCKAYDDLRLTQEQLLQSEKMSAVGQLIAGVAHELNNPLTAILGYAQLLEAEKLEARALEYAGKIFKQAQRTHRVVQNLLSFARQRKPQKEQFDVVNVLNEALTLREYDMKVNKIVVERETGPDIPAVGGDPHQLEQVFLNIINNALDAMLESEGKIFKVTVAHVGKNVVIEFHDSGPGIKEAHRIFEPFYTTKSIGKGTGLGLSICYGIVKEHGGEISARNDEAGGAIIEVRLPSVGRAVPLQPAREPVKHESALEGRILLVEDEEAVLDFERDVLAGAGAQVTHLTGTEQMKSILEDQTFDALIINGKMPGSGSVPEMRRWIVESWPELGPHLLFTFASLAEPDVRSFLEQNGISYLVKPFQVADLISATRKILVKARAASTGKP